MDGWMDGWMFCLTSISVIFTFSCFKKKFYHKIGGLSTNCPSCCGNHYTCVSLHVCVAVKAGGMRIVQKHQAAAAPEPPQKDDDEEYVSSSPPKAPVIVSGVITKGDKDFTPAAAQVAHQKPQPGVPKLPHTQHINQHIHQPRK
uniref:Death associated protein n=1 Tax=Stegastes partitus TaxID=144197 RepID=A0A3B4ZBS3_9TELE